MEMLISNPEKHAYLLIGTILFIISPGLTEDDTTSSAVHSRSVVGNSALNIEIDCLELQPGQFYCDDPVIDPETQEASGCTREGEALVKCFPSEGIKCEGLLQDSYFNKTVACKWTNGKKFSVAVLLSVFLGWLGIDRFYLGYPAIGMLKFCTFGFMFLWHLVDILLIAIQVVVPADGSNYIVDYYGPGLHSIASNNETYIKPPNYNT